MEREKKKEKRKALNTKNYINYIIKSWCYEVRNSDKKEEEGWKILYFN